MLARLIAIEHRDYLEAEREALRRSECNSVGFYEVEPENFETLGMEVIVGDEMEVSA